MGHERFDCEKLRSELVRHCSLRLVCHWACFLWLCLATASSKLICTIPKFCWVSVAQIPVTSRFTNRYTQVTLRLSMKNITEMCDLMNFGVSRKRFVSHHALSYFASIRAKCLSRLSFDEKLRVFVCHCRDFFTYGTLRPVCWYAPSR